MIDRRQFLCAAGAVGLSVTGGAYAKALRLRGPAIGVQLYMLRDLLAQDLEGTLAAIAGLGIRYVEFAGYYGRSPAAWRALLRSNGLRAIGAHGLYPDMSDDLVSAAIETGAAIGLDWLVAAVPRLPGLKQPITEASFRAATQRITLDDIKATADRFNRIGELVKSAGMRFAYHNHGFDFRRYEGRYGLDLILERTDPTLVALQLDIGNTIAAGADPMPYLVPNGRLRLVHVKDWKGPYSPSLDQFPASAPIGDGTIKWRPILTSLASARIPYAFIEQEGIEATAAMDLLARNFHNLQKVMK